MVTEATITRPMASSVSTRPTSTMSGRGGAWRAAAGETSVPSVAIERLHGPGESLATRLIVTEHVLACAGRCQHDRITRPGQRGGHADGITHRVCKHHRH